MPVKSAIMCTHTHTHQAFNRYGRGKGVATHFMMVEQSRTGTRATVDSSSLLRMATAACPDSLRSKLLVGVAQLSPRHRLRQLVHQWLKLPHLRPRIDATSAWSAGGGFDLYLCITVLAMLQCGEAEEGTHLGEIIQHLGDSLKILAPII